MNRRERKIIIKYLREKIRELKNMGIDNYYSQSVISYLSLLLSMELEGEEQ